MAFDKKNAMRNAERYLSQGKIRLAINEYKQVIKHDPRDYGTLNMLGDLYVKDLNNSAAVKCYKAVAEHYGKQGFAAKAIAVYNKITRIAPITPEVSEKLAELYHQKGSVTEAKSHYVTLAEHYQKTGRKTEALAIWQQVALLDPNNTEVYKTLGESFLAEDQPADAVNAFVALGDRFRKLRRAEDAIAAYERARSIDRYAQAALAGLAAVKIDGGNYEEAVAELEGILAEKPHNRDVIRLLIDCHLGQRAAKRAEEAVVRLVEVEPANYDLFLAVAKLYLEMKDADSAARALTMSSEHLLASGQVDDYRKLVHDLLDIDASNIEGLRLLVGLCTWLRDEPSYIDALKRLAKSARSAALVDDERSALLQLTMVVPHEVVHGERLRELNREHGFEEEAVADDQFDRKFVKGKVVSAAAASKQTAAPPAAAPPAAAKAKNGNGKVTKARKRTSKSEPKAPKTESPKIAEAQPVVLNVDEGTELITAEHIEDQQDRLWREIDSVKFYVENGYVELAEKAVVELRADFGERKEVLDLVNFIAKRSRSIGDELAQFQVNENGAANGNGNSNPGFSLEDLKNELGLEDIADEPGSDFEIHYNTAIAYKEMGLLEESIREFQNAASGVGPNDGTRRFYQCANMLGHCFMEIGKAHLALKWFERALETNDLSADEKQGLWYEVANACEANGENDRAAEFFERVYAENIDFRDVSARLEKVAVAA